MLARRSRRHGIPKRGPKPVLQAALQAGIIPVSDEAIWAQMLADRDLASHIYYDEELALELFTRIKSEYLPALQAAVVKLS